MAPYASRATPPNKRGSQPPPTQAQRRGATYNLCVFPALERAGTIIEGIVADTMSVFTWMKRRTVHEPREWSS
jgi:hypothetical protein